MALDPHHEGKILASAADLCGFCDQQIAIKQCLICSVDLCVICVKGHNKLPTTKDHSLTNIEHGDAASKSTRATAQNGVCTKHIDKPFTMVCKDCVEIGCDACEIDHKGHLVQKLNDDPKLCHRVVGKNIQRLLDDVHELEEIKSVLEGQICAYDDALVRVDHWEVDLLQLVKEKADKIRSQLKDLKDEKYQQLSDQVNGLMAKLKVIDQSITQMTAIRKSMDFTALSISLSKSQYLIKHLEDFKEDMKPVPLPFGVDDVLQNEGKIKDIDDDLELMFTVGDIDIKYKGHLPVAEWRFTAANGGKDLSTNGRNHVTMHNVTYGPGPSEEAQGAVVVPMSDNWSMIVMNPDAKLRFSGEMTFFINLFGKGKDTGSSGLVFFYDTGVTSAVSNGTYVFIYENYTRLSICSGSHFNTPRILTPNSWNKIAVVFSPTTILVYVNGTIAHIENKVLDLSHTHVGHLHFGRRPGQNRFEGRIASCKFYNVALDEDEIKKL